MRFLLVWTLRHEKRFRIYMGGEGQPEKSNLSAPEWENKLRVLVLGGGGEEKKASNNWNFCFQS